MEWVAIDGVAAWPTRQRPAATIVNLGNSSRGEGPMALIAVGPTEQAQEPRARRTRDPAPHGEWQIELRTSSSLEEPVHAYIARNDMGLNTPQRGEQSYFQDDDDVDSYLRSPIDDADIQNEDDQRLFGERNSQTVVVRRRGTSTASPQARLLWSSPDIKEIFPLIGLMPGMRLTLPRVNRTFRRIDATRPTADDVGSNRRVGASSRHPRRRIAQRRDFQADRNERRGAAIRAPPARAD
jgi:hypothetical protein